MAGDENTGATDTSILETPPYFIALLLSIFLVITLGFERLLHWCKRRLEGARKHGLVRAMDHMSNELMLLGVATLILINFQKDISKVCVSSSSYMGKTWLDNVHGCACCLSRTSSVTACYLAAKGCSSPHALSDCCERQDDEARLPKICVNIFNDSYAPYDDRSAFFDYKAEASGGLLPVAGDAPESAASLAASQQEASQQEAASPADSGMDQMADATDDATSAVSDAPGSDMQVSQPAGPSEPSQAAQPEQPAAESTAEMAHAVQEQEQSRAQAAQEASTAQVLPASAGEAEQTFSRRRRLLRSCRDAGSSLALQQTHRRIPGRVLSSTEAPKEAHSCNGRTPVAYEQCGFRPDRRPILTELAIHQIHLFIFGMAMTHILLGIAAMLCGYLRLASWRRWARTLDHQTLAVQRALEDHRSQVMLSEWETRGDEDSPATPLTLPRRDWGDSFSSQRIRAGSDGLELVTMEGASPKVHRASPGKQRLAPLEPLEPLPAESGAAQGAPGTQESSVPTTPTPTPAGSRESSMRAGLRSRRASEAQGPEGAAPAPPPRRVQGTSERLMLQLQGMQPEPGAAADPASSRHRPLCPHALELLACVGRQFCPNSISRAEFYRMRASLHLTHHINLNTEFQIVDYVAANAEDKLSHVVGLGLPMWMFVVIFVLLSSEIGWCIWVFIIAAGVLLLLINTQIIAAGRLAAQGKEATVLSSSLPRWLLPPHLMLPLIKLLLFFVSFVFSNAIFFAAHFGADSCFFSTYGFQGVPFPWWSLMIVNTVYFLSISLVTLPVFSLVSLLDNNGIRTHLLAPEMRAALDEAGSQVQPAKDARKGSLASHKSLSTPSSSLTRQSPTRQDVLFKKLPGP